jgi:hypothetical protein
MDLNLTVGGLSFNHLWGDEAGSKRREIARGATLPTDLRIRHQAYVDAKYKVPGSRTNVQFDHYMTMTDGVIRPVSLYMVLARPDDPLVTTGIITGLSDLMVNLIHGTTNTSGLGLKTAILASREQ